MNVLILLHVVSGLLGISSGLVAVAGMFRRNRMPRWNAIFLTTTLAAAVTGFCFFPVDGFTSAQLVGVFCTILLALATYGRYFRHLAGSWDKVYIITAVEALYLNCLIAIAQSFQHFRWLRNVAPTQSSPVYVIIKWMLLISFIVIGFLAVKRVVKGSSDQSGLL